MIIKLTKKSGEVAIAVNMLAIDYLIAHGSNTEIIFTSGRGVIVLESIDLVLSKIPRG